MTFLAGLFLGLFVAWMLTSMYYAINWVPIRTMELYQKLWTSEAVKNVKLKHELSVALSEDIGDKGE